MATSVSGQAAPVIAKPTDHESPAAPVSAAAAAPTSSIAPAPEPAAKPLTEEQLKFRADLEKDGKDNPYDLEVSVQDQAKEPLKSGITNTGCVTATCYTTCNKTCVTC